MKNELKHILEMNDVWSEELSGLVNLYKELYGLTVIKKREVISDNFYEYCLKGRYFVVTALYNKDKKFIVRRDFSKGENSWGLVGGWVKEGEGFDRVVDDVVLRKTGGYLVEAMPIAIVENTFVTNEGREVVHEGIAFMVLVRNEDTKKNAIVLTDDPFSVLGKRDQKILELAQAKLKNKVNEAPFEEIESYKGLNLKKIIHNLVIKPISYWGSSRVLKKAIKTAIGDVSEKTVLDVACGDDDLVCELADRAKLVVANDISRASMKTLMEKGKSNLVFSNQNMVEIDFNIKFDVIIVKNVMHHLRDAEEMDLFLEKMRLLGRKIIIMDVQNPKENIIAWLWNRYYVNFLNDQGGFFINFTQFRKILGLYFGEKLESSELVWTIKGPFMLAIIKND